eukprot:5640975-Prymnesium_polylepis.1
MPWTDAALRGAATRLCAKMALFLRSRSPSAAARRPVVSSRSQPHESSGENGTKPRDGTFGAVSRIPPDSRPTSATRTHHQTFQRGRSVVRGPWEGASRPRAQLSLCGRGGYPS